MAYLLPKKAYLFPTDAGEKKKYDFSQPFLNAIDYSMNWGGGKKRGGGAQSTL